MRLLSTLLLLLLFKFSLHAITSTDATYAFDTCADVDDTNTTMTLEINATDMCHVLTGYVDNNGADADDLGPFDIYLFKNPNDYNLSYQLIDINDGKDLEYQFIEHDETNCGTTTIETDDGIIYEGNFTSTPAPEYTTFLITTSSNQPSEYQLIVGVEGQCISSGDGVEGSSESNANADVIDTFTTVLAYNDSNDTSSSGIKYIKTKKSAETATITAVYLNDSNMSADFNNGGQDYDKAVFFLIPLLNDMSQTGSCPALLNSDKLENLFDADEDPGIDKQVIMIIYDEDENPVTPPATPNQDFSVTANVRIPAHATKEARIEYIVVDSSTLGEDAQNCVSVSSTTGNLEGLGQCVNSEVQYVDAYGQTAYDRCATNTTHGQPCLSTNGGYGSGIFNNPLGCFMCTFYAGTACSTDNFSIRPERFDINSTNTHMPDLLRAGSDYNLTIHAYDYATTTDTQDYNQISSNLDTTNSIKWLNTTPFTLNATTATLPYTGSPNLGDFNMTDGLSSYNGFTGEVASFSYDDIGFMTLRVEDRNWALVDNDDTNQSCAEDGTYICGDKNITAIPHHFSFSDINITNQNGPVGTGNFTYIANLDDTNQSTFAMSGRVQVTLVAENEANTPTVNFDSGAGFYENPLSVSSAIAHAVHGDANRTTVANALLGGFTTGSKTFIWNDDSNLSQVLRFNFPRDINNSFNPFVINPTDVNLSVTSTYTPSISTADNNVTGAENGLGDGSTTFVYGRTNSPRSRFTEDTGQEAFIYYEVFCDGTDNANITCNPTLINFATSYTNDPRWFINTAHTSSTSGIAGSVNQKSYTARNGVALNAALHGAVTEDVAGPHVNSVLITYDTSKGHPYKTTMENNASSWLLYNKYDIADDKNEFEVEFEDGNTSWAGQRATTNTTNKKGTEKVNRRSLW